MFPTKKIQTALDNWIGAEKEISITAWATIFLGAIFTRSFIEQFLAVAKPVTILETIYNFIHNFYFFSIALILIWITLSLTLKINPRKLSFLFIFSLFFIIAPSLIDMAQNHGEIYWSFYLLSSPADLLKQYLTIFGHLPSGIAYFGTKIVFLAAVLILSGFTWLMTKNLLKTVTGAIGSYSILFFMGSFPTISYYVYTFFSGNGKIDNIRSFNIAGFFGSPEKILGIQFPSLTYMLAYKLNFIYYLFLLFVLAILFWLTNRKKIMVIIKNLRLPQIIYQGGLFFIGLGLGILQYSENFHLNFFSFLAILISLASIWLSWESSVIINDINDLKIDKISNPERPLPQNAFTSSEYAQLGILFLLLAILGGITLDPAFAVLLIIYQIIAWSYSAKPYRLKRFPLIATFVSSLASLTILFLGYILMSDGQTIETLSWRITLLLLITYTISIPIKDFKDIEGDKADGVWTIPVIFGEKKARLIVAINLFISYILSVFFLNELKLFWWAVLFGTLTFLTVNSPKIKPRQLFWPVLGLAAVYGGILVKIVFL